MDKGQIFAVASAMLTLANCAQQSVKPIEIKGPLVDTPQGYSRPIRRPVSAPATVPVPPQKPDEPSVPGSDADLGKRLDDISAGVKTLDNKLRPNRGDTNDPSTNGNYSK